jgi:hypothetical protein
MAGQSQMNESVGPHTKQKIKRVSGIELFLELETLPSPLREHLINELKSIQNRVEAAERKLKSAELIIRDLEERLGQREMPVGVLEKEPKSQLEEMTLIRKSAVSWIEQRLRQRNTLGYALAFASQLYWGGRRYSARTLESWLYQWRAKGCGGLARQSRSDRGLYRAFSPQAVEAIINLRRAEPSLPVPTLVSRLEVSGVLEPGTFSRASVYRLLRREGLNRSQLIAAGSGPSKAVETQLANAISSKLVRQIRRIRSRQ